MLIQKSGTSGVVQWMENSTYSALFMLLLCFLLTQSIKAFHFFHGSTFLHNAEERKQRQHFFYWHLKLTKNLPLQCQAKPSTRKRGCCTCKAQTAHRLVVRKVPHVRFYKQLVIYLTIFPFTANAFPPDCMYEEHTVNTQHFNHKMTLMIQRCKMCSSPPVVLWSSSKLTANIYSMCLHLKMIINNQSTNLPPSVMACLDIIRHNYC